MAAEERSKTGVWIDSATGQVVEAEPVEGVQIVPADGELTPAVQAAIEAAKANAPVVSDDGPAAEPEPSEPEPDQVVEAEPVEGPEAEKPAKPARGTVKKAAPRG